MGVAQLIVDVATVNVLADRFSGRSAVGDQDGLTLGPEAARDMAIQCVLRGDAQILDHQVQALLQGETIVPMEADETEDLRGHSDQCACSAVEWPGVPGFWQQSQWDAGSFVPEEESGSPAEWRRRGGGCQSAQVNSTGGSMQRLLCSVL